MLKSAAQEESGSKTIASVTANGKISQGTDRKTIRITRKRRSGSTSIKLYPRMTKECRQHVSHTIRDEPS